MYKNKDASLCNHSVRFQIRKYESEAQQKCLRVHLYTDNSGPLAYIMVERVAALCQVNVIGIEF